MKKKDKKLLKRIILEQTKGLKKELKHQEQLVSGKAIDYKGDEYKVSEDIKSGANYTVGYITATLFYKNIFLNLIKMNSKELKQYIKDNNKIKKKNKKHFKEIIKKITKK